MSHHSTAVSAESQWRSAFSAARAGRGYFEQPYFHVAQTVVAQTRGQVGRSHDRWLSRSIPQIASSSRSRLSCVDVARWLVSSRAALYALWAMRRLGGAW